MLQKGSHAAPDLAALWLYVLFKTITFLNLFHAIWLQNVCDHAEERLAQPCAS